MIECPYCHKESVLVDSKEIYGKSYGMSWWCRPCDAYVGCHEGTDKPLGRLADKELREWKIKAHAAFDPLWRTKMRVSVCSKSKARRLGYKWLSNILNIDVKDCHIGMFDTDMCKRVVEVCA